MFGSMIVDYLSRDSQFSLTATVRTADLQDAHAGGLSESPLGDRRFPRLH